MISKVLDICAQLGEGPVWDDRENTLWWVDIENHLVHCTDPVSGRNTSFAAGDYAGCAVLAESGLVLLARKDDLAWLDPQTGLITPLKPLEEDNLHHRFNDGKCDPAGRLWFGSMHFEHEADCNLYRLDNQHAAPEVVISEVAISNGLGWSPDWTRMYYTDSPEKRIDVFDYDHESGRISNRRPLIDLGERESFPDGLCVDEKGNVWSAQWDGACLLKISPQGLIIDEVALPVQRPTSCAFGGPELDKLYVTSASEGLTREENEDGIANGNLLVFDPGVRGMAVARFRDNEEAK